MKRPSERAQLVLARYKEAAAMGAADKARLGDVIHERVLRGDLPRFDVQLGAPIASPAVVGQKLGSSIFAKLAMAVLVLGAAGGVAHQLQKEPPPRVHDALAALPAPAPPAAALASATLPEAPRPLTGARRLVATASSLPQLKPEKKRTEAAGPSASAGEPTIDEEVKLVTGAQVALRAGDTRRALELLNEHAKRFPSGKLANLRQVTHMMALCQSGHAQQARDEAGNFLARNPSSPFAERVSGICSTGK
jgi:hypothetical protein